MYITGIRKFSILAYKINQLLSLSLGNALDYESIVLCLGILRLISKEEISDYSYD